MGVVYDAKKPALVCHDGLQDITKAPPYPSNDEVFIVEGKQIEVPHVASSLIIEEPDGAVFLACFYGKLPAVLFEALQAFKLDAIDRMETFHVVDAHLDSSDVANKVPCELRLFVGHKSRYPGQRLHGKWADADYDLPIELCIRVLILDRTPHVSDLA